MRADSQIGINGHLFARHRVQSKPRTNLRHSAGAFGDDHEVHNDQHREHNQTHKQVSAHDEHGEAFDDVAGSVGTRMALADDQFGRGYVQRQAQHQRCQKHARE